MASDVELIKDVGDDDLGSDGHAAKRHTSLEEPEAKRFAPGPSGATIHVSSSATGHTDPQHHTVTATDNGACSPAAAHPQHHLHHSHDSPQVQQQAPLVVTSPQSQAPGCNTIHRSGSTGASPQGGSKPHWQHHVVTTGLNAQQQQQQLSSSPAASLGADSHLPAAVPGPLTTAGTATSPFQAAAGRRGSSPPDSNAGAVFAPVVASAPASAAAGECTQQQHNHQQQRQQPAKGSPHGSSILGAHANQQHTAPADVWGQANGSAKPAPGLPPSSVAALTASTPFLAGAPGLTTSDRVPSQHAMDRMHSSASLSGWLPGVPQGPSFLSSSGSLSAPLGAAAAAAEGQGAVGSSSSGGGGRANGGLSLEQSFSLSRWIRPKEGSGSFSWPQPIPAARSLSSESLDMEIQLLPAVTPEQYPLPESPHAGAPAGADAPAGSCQMVEGNGQPVSPSERGIHRKYAAWERELLEMLGPEHGYEPLSIKEIVACFKERIATERDKEEFKSLCDRWTYVTEHPPGSGVKCLAMKAWLRQPVGQEEEEEEEA